MVLSVALDVNSATRALGPGSAIPPKAWFPVAADGIDLPTFGDKAMAAGAAKSEGETCSADEFDGNSARNTKEDCCFVRGRLASRTLVT